jgi:hypothetical protein
MIGLTPEEAAEFAELDALEPFDEHGRLAWSADGRPTNQREARWRELYEKHAAAVTAMSTTPAGRRPE